MTRAMIRAKLTPLPVTATFVFKAPMAPENISTPSCPGRPGGPEIPVVPDAPVAPAVPRIPGIPGRPGSDSTTGTRGMAPITRLKSTTADDGATAAEATKLTLRNASKSVSNIVSISSTPLEVRGQEIRYCCGRRGAILNRRQSATHGNHKSGAIAIKCDQEIRAIQPQTCRIQINVVICRNGLTFH